MPLTIAKKLALGFAAMTLLTVGTTIFVEQNVARMAQAQDHAFNRLTVAAKTASAIEGDLDAALAYHRGYIILGTAETKADRASAWTKINQNLEQLNRLSRDIDSPTITKKTQALTALLPQYHDAQQQIIDLDLSAPGQHDHAVTLCRETVTPLATLAGQAAEDLLTETSQLVQSTEQELLARSRTLVDILIYTAVCSVLLALTLAFLTSRSILKPLRAVIDRIAQLAEGDGDLTQRVDETRRDELGELGAKVNAFITNTHDVIATVRQTTHEVATAATEISATAEQTATTMTQQTQRVDEISRAIEEMNSAVIDVAQKAADASNTSNRAGQAATQGGDVVHQTIEGMTAISQAVTDSARSVEELGKRGDQIGEIIAVINDIADQTNLLALNAAIEAARAGEHGRGFAVVADEVRKLADRTTQATDEIAQSITAIQNETRGAVERMDAGTIQVERGVESAREAGTSLAQIVGNANEVAAMIHSIAAATEEQSATADQISRSIDATSSAIRETADGAAQSSLAVTSLSEKAEELQRVVYRFKLADQPNT
ncbi:MAG: methyl-accepting chemotaxis protein [Planctomycetota bacterium]